MAQVAAAMILVQESYAGRIPVLTGIGKARFIRPLYPGMNVQICAQMLEEWPEAGIVLSRCRIMSVGKRFAEAEITLSMQFAIY